jgi:prefoldin subunit 5
MKKGLLSILAGALLVVGCQNYDDQFDQLESQISALSSTVAGLSQVQSDLAALSGTVNSLQSALSAEIDTALADGLADIDAAVDALEAAAADSCKLQKMFQAIADAVAENQTDLDELLAQSSVFQGNVKVSTPAMLDAYHAMGDGLAIVNGYVDIDVTAAMNIATVQELVEFILVTTGDFAYTAGYWC